MDINNEKIKLEDLQKLTEQEIQTKIDKNGNVWSFNVEIDNKLYSAMYSNKLGFTLWGDNGSTHLHECIGIINKEDILEIITQFKNGFVKCSKCGKFIDPNKSNQIFAGYYCDKCFTKDIKEERDWAYSHLD